MIEGESSVFDTHKQNQQDIDFLAYKANITRAIEHDTPENPSIWLGPTITVKSDDKTVSFKTLVLNTNNLSVFTSETGESTPIPYEREIYLLGYDDKGNYIGRRFTQVGQQKTDSVMFANGGLTLDQRGKGYAKFFEIANTHILQRITTGRNSRLLQNVLDINKVDLTRIQLEYKDLKESHPNDDHSRIEYSIKQLQLEHDRWLHIWGPQGILGFSPTDNTDTYEKKFQPETTQFLYDIPLEELSDISLEIEDGFINGHPSIRPYFANQRPKQFIDHAKELAQIQKLVQN